MSHIRYDLRISCVTLSPISTGLLSQSSPLRWFFVNERQVGDAVCPVLLQPKTFTLLNPSLLQGKSPACALWFVGLSFPVMEDPGLRIVRESPVVALQHLWSRFTTLRGLRARELCSGDQEFSNWWRSKFIDQRDWIHVVFATENKEN